MPICRPFLVALIFFFLLKMKTKKIVEVVAALVFDASGRVLAAQCAPHKHGGGWEFPGGKMEPGESPATAVQREIAEELGMQVQAENVLYTVEWDYPAFHLRMHCLPCRWVDGDIRLREHLDFRWLHRCELYDLSWLPADVEVLEPLSQYMENYHG